MPQDHTVFITGASRGIGLALAKLYVGQGARVFGNGRSAAPAETVEGLVYGRIKMTGPDEQVFEEAGFDHLDTLILNGADFGPPAPGNPLHADVATLKRLTAQNAFNQLRLIQVALPWLKRAAAPRVAFVISYAGDQRRMDGSGSIYYRVSKATQLSVALSLQTALKDEGIILRLINPGWVRTRIGGKNAKLDADESAAGIKRIIDEASLEDEAIGFSFDGSRLPFGAPGQARAGKPGVAAAGKGRPARLAVVQAERDKV